MYLNKVQIIGRMVKNPEIKYVTTGTPLCTFTLANSFKNKPEYYNCGAWDKLAESIGEHVEQGQEVYVEGRLKTDSWEKDGVKHYRTKIVVERISFGAKKSRIPGEDDEQWNYPKDQETAVSQPVVDNDQVPF